MLFPNKILNTETWYRLYKIGLVWIYSFITAIGISQVWNELQLWCTAKNMDFMGLSVGFFINMNPKSHKYHWVCNLYSYKNCMYDSSEEKRDSENVFLVFYYDPERASVSKGGMQESSL